MKKSELLDYNYDIYFEPENPITTPKEFTDEIIKHFSKENTFVSIVEESMEPVISIEETTYVCKLGEPCRTAKFLKMPINTHAGRFLGFKWVYIYKK